MSVLDLQDYVMGHERWHKCDRRHDSCPQPQRRTGVRASGNGFLAADAIVPTTVIDIPSEGPGS